MVKYNVWRLQILHFIDNTDMKLDVKKIDHICYILFDAVKVLSFDG